MFDFELIYWQKTVDIVSHSMGNHFTMGLIKQTKVKLKKDQIRILFAAADVGRDEFRKVLKESAHQLAGHILFHTSDMALFCSSLYHVSISNCNQLKEMVPSRMKEQTEDSARVGSNPVTLVDSSKTLIATDASSRSGFWRNKNHGYFRDSYGVAVIAYFINGKLDAPKDDVPLHRMFQPSDHLEAQADCMKVTHPLFVAGDKGKYFCLN